MVKNKQLVIVESPAKARTIERFLDKSYHVTASMGHIRDLPKSKLGVDPEADFEPTYVVPKDKSKVIKQLKDAAKKADQVILATDEDREGEAIAWHLAEAIGLKSEQTKRVVFHEITKEAILAAMANPRTLDIDRVNAQQARRILDRLVGYKLSPFLWRKVMRGLSAGRVQSVAVRLIVDREKERDAFKAEEYWTIDGLFGPKQGGKKSDQFTARLHRLDDSKIELGNEADTMRLKAELEAAAYVIDKVEKKTRKRNPSPPFTTSTLQQEAARKLRFSAKKTMYLAQQLYEGVEIGGDRTGLITYMRTDSLNLAESAVKAIRDQVARHYGQDYLPKGPQQYKTKSKGAQEAHEAIRPTSIERMPESVESHLSKDQLALYDLIYKRTMACQMQSAVLDQTTVDIAGTLAQAAWKQAVFRATGSVIKFDGFLAVYEEGKDDEDEKSAEAGDNVLPDGLEEMDPDLKSIDAEQHFTQPPPRYSEATLVKTLEENGIGRPSTYAPIISTILDRGYVRLESRRFVPEEVGKVVTNLLVEHFPEIVDVGFTARMEGELDDVATGERQWQPMLREFYEPFVKTIADKQETVSRTEVTAVNELGNDPKTGKPMTVRIGRYGPYVQKGDKDDEEKPVFASIPSNLKPEELTLEQALKLFDLPRKVGETDAGEEIIANVGRYGPYLKVGKSNYSLGNEDDPYTLTKERALEVVKEAKEKQAQREIKVFEEQGIKVLNGRYGPYITDGKKNAKIPKDKEPADLTLEECQDLIAQAPEKKRRWKRKK